MKTIFLNSLVVLGVAILLTGSALAQSVPMKVHVPFDFSVGDTKLEAGDYRLSVILGHVLNVQGVNGGGAFVQTMGTRVKTKIGIGQLVFNRYGDAYFLTQAFWEGYDTGRELHPSKQELQIAAGKATPEKLRVSLGSLRSR